MAFVSPMLCYLQSFKHDLEMPNDQVNRVIRDKIVSLEILRQEMWKHNILSYQAFSPSVATSFWGSGAQKSESIAHTPLRLNSDILCPHPPLPLLLSSSFRQKNPRTRSKLPILATLGHGHPAEEQGGLKGSNQ